MAAGLHHEVCLLALLRAPPGTQGWICEGGQRKLMRTLEYCSESFKASREASMTQALSLHQSSNIAPDMRMPQTQSSGIVP